jgi:hypothetical protein
MATIIHIIALILGAYIWYLTFVMRETTEGVWINRIQELWERIDAHSKSTPERTIALFNVVANKVNRTFNRIVGVKIISPRLVGISVSLSFASATFILGAIFELLAYLIVKYSDSIKQLYSSPDAATRANAATVMHSVPVLMVPGLIFLCVSAAFALLAFLPIFFKSRIWEWVSCVPTILVFLLFSRAIYLKLMTVQQMTFYGAIVASLASDILLIIIIRQSLRWMLARTIPIRMVTTVALQLLLDFCVFVLPIVVLVEGVPNKANMNLLVYALMLAMFNVPTAFASVSFVSALLIVLMHRVTWPLLSTWTRVLTRSDVLDKRKTFRWLGSGLFLYGLSGIPQLAFILRIFEQFHK